MQKMKLSILTLFISLALIAAGCGYTAAAAPAQTQAAPTEPAAPTETAPPIASPVPTSTPAPSPTPEPTSTPEPLPCNIAFDSDRDNNLEIYVMGPDGGGLLNLSNNPADDFSPAWSPDGSQIAFVSNRPNETGGGQFIYVMNADGSSLRQLTQENESKWPDWSYDGQQITYTHHGDIYIIGADGGESTNLTNSPEPEELSKWSPDSQHLAWLAGPEGSRQINLMDLKNGSVQQMTHSGQVYSFAWTVDGQLFAHWDNPDHGCYNCVLSTEGTSVIDADGKGELQRYLPFWTANGDRVELVQVDRDTGDEEIYLVSEIFEGIFFNLTNNPANDRNPDWPALCGPR